MYIIKNALISIKRNKGRNILLGIIILVIACATTITLAIRNSADTLIESYNSKYDITASISVDRGNMMDKFGQMRPGESSEENTSEDAEVSREEMMASMSESLEEANKISVEDIESYANSEYVESYYYTRSTNMNSDDLEKVSSSMGGGAPNDMKMPQDSSNTSVEGDFTITGYSSYEAMSEFIDGNYSITDGQVSDDFTSNSCVINEELATLNDISVGDELTFVDPNNDENTYKLTVTGIFKDSSTGESNRMEMFTGSANTIITNVSVINNISELNEDISVKTTPTFVLASKDVIDSFSNELTEKGLSEYLTVTTNLNTIATFVLASKDVIDSFSNELTEKGLSEYLTVTTNLNTIESATTSISNIKTFATTFLIVTFIIGGVVLFVINLINIRQRKYEIGVLRTIGMKKSLLTAQFTTELLLIAIISLTLGAGIGSAASVPVSNTLLKQEISSSESEMQSISKNFGQGSGANQDSQPGSNGSPGKGGMGMMRGVSTIQAFDSIDATVDAKVLLQLFAIGIGLTFISSSACMVSIQRFSPLTILKERS